jgi:hypothetical protein
LNAFFRGCDWHTLRIVVFVIYKEHEKMNNVK